MSDLPELRIVVEPYNGVFFKWHWEVQEKKRFKNHEYWGAVMVPTYSLLEGKTRDQEKALRKAREAAAERCEWHLSVLALKKNKEKNRVIEKVTCQEEPV